MLYAMPHHPATSVPKPCGPGLHYFESGEMLLRLQAEGRTRAELSRMTGLTVQQVVDRMLLMQLDDGLRAYLRQENVPERIALMLLKLPDALTRRRMASRIIRERLCIRDAALLVAAAGRKKAALCAAKPRGQHVISVIRDTRPYRNAIRDIAGQMNAAGVQATFTERRSGSQMELTVAYPARRRRTERHQAI